MSRYFATFGRLLIAIIVSTSGLASADVIQLVSPSANASVEGNSSIRPDVAPNRLQFFFPASDFAGLPASHRLLAAFNFRGDQTQTQAVDRIFPDGDFWISTTTRTSATLSTVFADNHGPDKTLVHSGQYTQHILGSGTPREFAESTHFQNPFYNDPAEGNLLIEHIWYTQGSASQPRLDVQSGAEIFILVGGSPNATSGSLFTGRSVTQFEFTSTTVPEPGAITQVLFVGAALVLAVRYSCGRTSSHEGVPI